jgi:large subunit ribosomal protein L24
VKKNTVERLRTIRIRKGDVVFVRTGQYAGEKGRVLYVVPKKNTVVVEGVKLYTRHQRKTPKNPKGGLVKMEGPIHISNVALFNPSINKPTRITTKVINEGGKMRKVRVCKTTGEQL